MTMRRLLALTLLAEALAVTSDARADDGPWDALGNMMRASPTITIVATSVVLLADGGFTAIGMLDALRDRSAERAVYATELAVAAPQAIGFAAAPLFFDIDRWSPAENLLILVPFQTWSAALTSHAIWSIARPDFDAGARLGVSFLVGLDTSMTSIALGSLSRGRWAPLEIGILEATTSVAQLGLAVERAVDDRDHVEGWGMLAAWSGLLTVHGALSVALSDPESSAQATSKPPSFVPYVAPSGPGLAMGVLGAF